MLNANSSNEQISKQVMNLSERIKNNALASPCIPLEKVEWRYNPREMIMQKIDSICDFLKCKSEALEAQIRVELESEDIPENWSSEIPHIYKKSYNNWFTEIANNNLEKYLPNRHSLKLSPTVRVLGWSSTVWRCWRMLERPNLVAPGIFKPSQFFVWNIIHDSVHVWQMQAYNKKWPNILSPNEFLFLEAQAIYVERVLLSLTKNHKVEIPCWYLKKQLSYVYSLDYLREKFVLI
ncbi:MAG: hypothetical protein F6J87_30205 [Spirulina sp. SIO3F2]|nr:hypothetical protein [Spirulina sp. SIO3F2]